MRCRAARSCRFPMRGQAMTLSVALTRPGLARSRCSGVGVSEAESFNVSGFTDDLRGGECRAVADGGQGGRELMDQRFELAISSLSMRQRSMRLRRQACDQAADSVPVALRFPR